MEIKTPKEYQQIAKDFLEIDSLSEWPEEVNAVFAVYFDEQVNNPEEVRRALSRGLGVDLDTIDDVDGGEAGKCCLSTEIMVNRGTTIHALDWIYEAHDNLDKALKGLNLEGSIILEA